MMSVKETRFEVHDRPRMPSLVPIAVIDSRLFIALENNWNGRLVEPMEGFLPLAKLEIASSQELTTLLFLTKESFISRLIERRH